MLAFCISMLKLWHATRCYVSFILQVFRINATLNSALYILSHTSNQRPHFSRVYALAGARSCTQACLISGLNTSSIPGLPRGYFFHPIPCPLSFHKLIISGIASIAFLLVSNLVLSVRSQYLPFTLWPVPVPFTRRPCSMRFCCLISGCFGEGGMRGSVWCRAASLKRSAWRRRE